MICFRKMSRRQITKWLKDAKEYKNIVKSPTDIYNMRESREKLEKYIQSITSYKEAMTPQVNNLSKKIRTEFFNLLNMTLADAKYYLDKQPKKKGKDCSGKVAQLTKELGILAIKGKGLQAKVTKCAQQGTDKCSRKNYDRFDQDLKKHKKLVEEKTQERTAASSLGTCFQPNLKF